MSDWWQAAPLADAKADGGDWWAGAPLADTPREEAPATDFTDAATGMMSPAPAAAPAPEKRGGASGGWDDARTGSWPDDRSEMSKGAASAVTGLKSMQPAFGIAGSSLVVQRIGERLENWDKIDRGEQVPRAEGLAYQRADAAGRQKLREEQLAVAAKQKDFIADSVKLVKQYQSEQRANKGKTTDFTDIESVKGFQDWLQFNGAAGAVYLAPVMISAAVGGPAGALATSYVLAAGELNSDRVAAAIDMNRPDRFRNPDRQDAVDPQQGIAARVAETVPQTAAFAAPNALMDAVSGPVRNVITKPLQGLTRREATKAAPGMVGRDIVEEGVTGTLQEGVNIAAERYAGEQQGDILTSENAKRLINAGTAEAAGGMVGGGANASIAIATARTPEQTAERVMSSPTVDDAIRAATEEVQAPLPAAAIPRQEAPAAAAPAGTTPAARQQSAAAVDNIARILGQESADVRNPVGTPGQPAGSSGAGSPDGVGSVLDGGLQPDGTGGRGIDPAAAGAVERGDAAVPAGDGDSRGAAALAEPIATWVGRRGDGYATEEDAQAAMPSRQRARADLDWKIEPTPEGRFRLAGYAQSGVSPAQSGAVAETATNVAPEAPSTSTQGFRVTRNPSGTVTVQGDPQAIRQTLAAAGVDKIAASPNGVMVGLSQAQRAMEVLAPQVREVSERIQQLERATDRVDSEPRAAENRVDGQPTTPSAGSASLAAVPQGAGVPAGVGEAVAPGRSVVGEAGASGAPASVARPELGPDVSGLGEGDRGAREGSAGQPAEVAAPQFRATLNPSGTLTIQGDPEAIKAILSEAGISGVRRAGGVLVGKSQAQAAQRLPALQTNVAERGGNPFRTFLMRQGVALKLAREFAPGSKERLAMGRTFREGGLELDALAERAVEQGFISDRSQTDELYEMISRTVASERIAPLVGQDADLELQAVFDARRQDEEAQAIAALERLSDNELDALDAYPWEKLSKPSTLAEGLRALGATEQEIEDAEAEVARERAGAQPRADGGVEPVEAAGGQAQVADRGRAVEAGQDEGLSDDGKERTAERAAADARQDQGAGPAERSQRDALREQAPAGQRGRDADVPVADALSAEAEGLTSPSEQDILAQQERRQQGERADTKRRTEEDNRARADAERDEFTLSGSDRPADANPAQRDAFDAPMQARGALEEISAAGDLFALPKSDKGGLEAIAADIAPSITVSKPSSFGLETTYTLTDASGNSAKVAVRKPNPYGPSAYGLMMRENGPEAIEDRPGTNPYDVDQGVEDVFINISEAKPGTGFGEMVYGIAANFAHNTGRIFIGDPAGLSDVALRRRLEQMISSALKFGTTAHLAPHPRQVEGDKALGVPPLRWTYGDHDGNVERMIEVSRAALAKAFPKASLIQYDPTTAAFFRADNGTRFTERAELARVVGRSLAGRFAVDGGTGRTGQAGWRTLARNALFGHLQASLRDAPVAQRGSLLERLGKELARLERDPATGGAYAPQERIFYARGVGNEAAQRRTEFTPASMTGGSRKADVQKIVDRVKAKWENGPPVYVVQTVDELPGEDTPDDVRGLYMGGRIWVVAGQHKPGADFEHSVARTLAHEVIAHHGLRAMLGKTAWEKLMDDIQLGIRAKNKELLRIQADVRKAYVDPKTKEYLLSPRQESDEIAAQAVEEAIDADGNFKPGYGFVKAIFAKVAAWLREHGFDVTFTNAELQGMLVLSMRNMERGERTVGGGQLAVAAAREEGPMQARSLTPVLEAPEDGGDGDARGARGRLDLGRVVPAAANEGLSNDTRRAAEKLSELLVSEADVVQPFGKLDVVEQGRVLAVVRTLLQDLKVLDAVVRLVPVDVVNVLGGKQLSAETLLNEPSVLVDLLPADADDLVAGDVQAMNVLAPLVARLAAELHAGNGLTNLAGVAEELRSALAAGEVGHILDGIIRETPSPYKRVKDGSPVTKAERDDFMEGAQFARGVDAAQDGESLSPGDEFWRKIRTGEPFSTQELEDAFAIGRRGTVRTGKAAAAGAVGDSLDPGAVHVAWAGEIAGFEGYDSFGVETSPVRFEVAFVPRELYSKPSEGALDSDAIIRAVFTRDGNRWRLDLEDPRPGTRAYEALSAKGRIVETGDVDDLGEPYSRVVLDKPEQQTRMLMQEAIRRLALHTGSVPAVHYIARATGAKAGRSPGREFDADFVQRQFARGTAADSEQESDLVSAWKAIASSDDAFRYPRSDSKDLEQVFAEVAPGLKIAPGPVDDDAVQSWRIYPQGEPQKYGYVIQYKDGRVELNVPRLKAGDGGSAAYAAVGNWVFNTSQKFAPDRFGLSDLGLTRRIENMASLALKFGTTDIFDASRNSLGLSWKDGDSAANIEAMLKASYERVAEKLPEINDYDYDFQARRIVSAADGAEVSAQPRAFAVELAGRARAAGLSAGPATLQRAILTGTLLRGQALPAQVRAAVDAAGVGGDGAGDFLNGVLYARSATAEGDTQAEEGWQMPEATRGDKVLYELQDGRIDLRRAVDAIKESGREIEERFDARLAETLFPGRVAYRSQTFLEQEVKPLLTLMAGNRVKIDEISDYLIARHAPERNEQVAKVNPDMPDGGAGRNSEGTLMTTAAANKYIASLDPARRKVLESVAARIDAITAGTRALLVQEGLEKPEVVGAWESAYKFYAPLFKDEADAGVPHPVGSGFSVKGSASKRAMGSQRQVTDVLGHVLMQREAAITRAEKNRVGLSLYGLVLSNPNPDFWTTIRPGLSDSALSAQLTAMGVDPDEAAAAMNGVPTIRTVDKTTNKVVERPNPLYKSLPGAITLKLAGEDRVVMLNMKDPRAVRLAESMKNLDGLTKFDLANTIIGQATRWIASVNTQYNPVFGFVNVVRDLQNGIVNLSSTKLSGHKAEVLGNVPAALIGIARDLRSDAKRTEWSDLFVKFQEAGGKTGYRELFRDASDRTKAIERELKQLDSEGKLSIGRAAHSVLDLLDDFNTALENAVRLSAFKAGMDSGLSEAESARIARELTVDFNRRGRTGREVGPLYAFFNASTQGTARTIATLKGPAGAKIIAGGIGLGIMQALMLAAAGFEDDDLPEFVKSRNLIIPTAWRSERKTYIAIPLGLGLHVLPNTGRIMAELSIGGGRHLSEKLQDAVGEIIGAFNPMGSANPFTLDGALKTAAPTVVDPLIELGFNKNFAGGQVERRPFSEEGDNRPGFTRARESTQRSTTGQVYLGISKAINTLTGGTDYEAGKASPTPEAVRYLAQVAGGGVLREMEKAVNASVATAKGEPVKLTAIPLTGRFFGEVDADAVEARRYFEAKSRINKARSSLRAAEKAGDDAAARKIERENPEVELYDDLQDTQRRIRNLNKLAVETINNGEQMREIDADRAREMKDLNDSMRKLEAATPTPAARLRSLAD